MNKGAMRRLSRFIRPDHSSARLVVAIRHWVQCGHCGQTYAAGRGERCALCGKDEGLRDVPRPVLRDGSDRASWAADARSASGAAFAGGCIGILLGATLGLVIALGLLADAAAEPPQADAAAEICGLGPGIVGFFGTVGRATLGMMIGGLVGGLVGLVLLTLGCLASADQRAGLQ
jgi:hypothetical protein